LKVWEVSDDYFEKASWGFKMERFWIVQKLRTLRDEMESSLFLYWRSEEGQSPDVDPPILQERQAHHIPFIPFSLEEEEAVVVVVHLPLTGCLCGPCIGHCAIDKGCEPSQWTTPLWTNQGSSLYGDFTKEVVQ
jgi:hypothetical protein